MSNNNWPPNGWYANGNDCGALDLSGNDHIDREDYAQPLPSKMKDASTQYNEADFGSDTQRKDVSTQYDQGEIKSPPRKKLKVEKPKRKLADIKFNLSVKPSGSHIGWSAYQKSLQGTFLKRLLDSPTEEICPQDKPSGPVSSKSSLSTAYDPLSCSGTWTSSSSSTAPTSIQQRLSSTGEVLPPDPFMVSASLADIEYIPTKEDYEYRDPRMAKKPQSEEHFKSRDPRLAAKAQTSMPSTSTSKKDYQARDPRLAARRQKQIATYDEYCSQLYYAEMRRSEVAAYLAQHYGIVEEREEGYEDTVNWDFEDEMPLSLMTNKQTTEHNLFPKYKLEDDDPPHIFNPMTQMYYRLFSGDQVQLEAEIHHPPSSGRSRKNSDKSQSSLEADMEVAKIMSTAPPDDFNEIIVIPATPDSSPSGSPPAGSPSPKKGTSPTGSMSPLVGSNASSSPPKSPSNQSDYSEYDDDEDKYSEVEYPEEEEIGPEGEEEGEKEKEGEQLEIKEDHFAHEDSTSANNENKENVDPAPREQPASEPASGGYEFDEDAYMNWIGRSSEFPKRRHSTS